MTMKTNVYSLDGKTVKQIELPAFFVQAYRQDLIKRAVLSDESREYQPQSNYRFAGFETSAKYRGRKEMYGAIKNKGIAHLPHEVQPKGQFGKVKRVPQAVKGHRAHPPRVEKVLIEEMNHKEYKKALITALSASANKEIVNGRNTVAVDIAVPIIVDNSFDSLKKTDEVLKLFDALNLGAFVERSRTAGSKGALIIASGNVLKAAHNIPGVDAVSASDLKVKHLAPGTHAGRLLIISEDALVKLSERLSS